MVTTDMALALSKSTMGPLEVEQWNVDAPRTKGGRRAWEDALAVTHVAFDVREDHLIQAHRGRILRRQFGGMALVECRSDSFAARRAQANMGDDSEDRIGFQVVRRGRERVCVGKRDAMILPGELMVWDGAQPVEIEVTGPFVKNTLILPRAQVLAASPRLADMPPVLPVAGGAFARLLARYIESLSTELPNMTGTALLTAADIALQLLRAAIEPALPDSRELRRRAARAQTRRYIDQNLQDPRLSPRSIAHAQAMSLRALHGLFEETGTSVGGLIRQGRLARCLEDLVSPSAGTITEISYRWGFSDSAYFASVFKRAFGMPPGAIRRMAVANDPEIARIRKEFGAPPII